MSNFLLTQKTKVKHRLFSPIADGTVGALDVKACVTIFKSLIKVIAYHHEKCLSMEYSTMYDKVCLVDL